MATFLVQIYRDEAQASGEQISPDYRAFMSKHAQALTGGAALQPAATARTVRKDPDGAAIVTDGPFIESKEVLGGYYVIEAADMAAALAIAADVPAPGGGVEVREIRVSS